MAGWSGGASIPANGSVTDAKIASAKLTAQSVLKDQTLDAFQQEPNSWMMDFTNPLIFETQYPATTVGATTLTYLNKTYTISVAGGGNNYTNHQPSNKTYQNTASQTIHYLARFKVGYQNGEVASASNLIGVGLYGSRIAALFKGNNVENDDDECGFLTSNAGGNETTDGITLTRGTWYWIYIKATTSSVEFRLSSTSVTDALTKTADATHSTNVPEATATLPPWFQVQRSAGEAANAATLEMDFQLVMIE